MFQIQIGLGGHQVVKIVTILICPKVLTIKKNYYYFFLRNLKRQLKFEGQFETN